MKHRLFALSLFLVLVTPGLVAFAPPQQDQSAIDITVSAGYGGYYRAGQWLALRITISNTGDNLDGHLRVRTDEQSGFADITYRTPIDLPQGARKQVFLYVSPDSYTRRLAVEVVDQNGDTIKRRETNIEMVGRGDVLYAVVTDSPFGAVDLTGDSPGTGRAFQANWRIEDIPPLADALSGLDVLLFHDVNTGPLTTEQVTAIERWVLAGGHLIVTGGDSWQRTTAAFTDLLPVTLQGTTPVQSLAALADYLGVSAQDVYEETTLTRSTPTDTARTLVTADGIPLVVRGFLGDGVIDFVAVDPNTEPLRSWDKQSLLWSTLVSSTGQQPSWARGFSSWTIARDATLTTSNTVLPTLLQLCGFLFLYIALIGPINYLVLKRVNRRELAWFTIPVLIVTFSFLAYSVGFNLRGNIATVNRMTVVRVWPQAEQAQTLDLIGIQSPRRATYDIAVDRGYVLRPLPQNGTGLNVPVIINESTNYTAQSIPIDAGMVASFSASGYIPAPSLDASAIWHLRADRTLTVSGSITNTTGMVLENAVVLIKGESRFLGTLDPEETRTFEISIGPQDPGPLSIGNPLNQYGLQYPSSASWPYSSSSNWCFSPEGLALTVPDVMRNEPFSCSSHNISDEQHETRRRYRLLGSLIVDTDISGGRDANVYLFAWTRASTTAVTLLDRPQTDEDTTLYIFELPTTVEPQDAQVEIPPALTTWTLTETGNPRTIREITPTRFRLVEDSQAVFEFMPMPAARLQTVDELIVNFQAQGPLTLAIWDWPNEEWRDIPVYPDVVATRIDDPEVFIGPENAVRLRIESQDDTSYNQVDYVKVSYRGQLAH
ncbi:MAG: hypothetical protein JW966_16600 [Anaerolineae bacterium]|nr:hypothetical protein [Anaerolineae bacterium]